MSPHAQSQSKHNSSSASLSKGAKEEVFLVPGHHSCFLLIFSACECSFGQLTSTNSARFSLMDGVFMLPA